MEIGEAAICVHCLSVPLQSARSLAYSDPLEITLNRERMDQALVKVFSPSGGAYRLATVEDYGITGKWEVTVGLGIGALVLNAGCHRW